jgi:hypothetical protein
LDQEKSVVTYNLSKSSLTNCTRLPNSFKIILLNIFHTFLKPLFMGFALKYCISTSQMTSAMSNKNGEIKMIKTFGNAANKFRHTSFP